MCKALIFIISVFAIFYISSCSNVNSQKTVTTFIDTIRAEKFGEKDGVSPPKQSIFYPDSSADTNMIFKSGNVSVYDINNSGGCSYNYDCVVKLINGTYKSFNIWDDNMLDIALDYDSIAVQELEINGRGNKELLIDLPLEGHHMYGDDEGGGWSYSCNWVEVWDIDEMKVLFQCKPYAETWTREEKDYFTFHQYDFKITPDNKIILSNLMKKVKDKLVPSKAKKADVRMGTYQFQNDSFVFVN